MVTMRSKPGHKDQKSDQNNGHTWSQKRSHGSKRGKDVVRNRGFRGHTFCRTIFVVFIHRCGGDRKMRFCGPKLCNLSLTETPSKRLNVLTHNDLC